MQINHANSSCIYYLQCPFKDLRLAELKRFLYCLIIKLPLSIFLSCLSPRCCFPWRFFVVFSAEFMFLYESPDGGKDGGRRTGLLTRTTARKSPETQNHTRKNKSNKSHSTAISLPLFICCFKPKLHTHLCQTASHAFLCLGITHTWSRRRKHLVIYLLLLLLLCVCWLCLCCSISDVVPQSVRLPHVNVSSSFFQLQELTVFLT